ncbi:MAG: hypothetical protein LBQ96_03310 [Fusobacteriaceae bacterium]|jgi:hypothetical protein|nr:hypothetical protein [Fusobacteriaceae bacterium]
MILERLRRVVCRGLETENSDRTEKKVKNAVLLLENEYFEILKPEVEKDLDSEERALFIEAEIQNRILEYDPAEYIRKEFVTVETLLTSELLLVLLKTEKAAECVVTAKENHISPAGIAPFFLYSLLFRENEETVLFMDIGLTRTVILKKKQREIQEAEVIYIEKNDLLEDSAEFSSFVERIRRMIPEEDEISAVLELSARNHAIAERLRIALPEAQIRERDFSKPLPCDSKHLEALNFLPYPMQNRLQHGKIRKFMMAVACLVILLELGLSAWLRFRESGDDGQRNRKEEELRILSQKVEEKRKETEELADYREQIGALRTRLDREAARFSEVLNRLQAENTEQLTLTFIEFGEKGKIKIRGKAIDDRHIYVFEGNVATAGFQAIRQDHIREKDGSYEFELDLQTGGEHD